jgi:hypothetical protein
VSVGVLTRYSWVFQSTACKYVLNSLQLLDQSLSASIETCRTAGMQVWWIHRSLEEMY